jgi:hypothetical protein
MDGIQDCKQNPNFQLKFQLNSLTHGSQYSIVHKKVALLQEIAYLMVHHVVTEPRNSIWYVELLTLRLRNL